MWVFVQKQNRLSNHWAKQFRLLVFSDPPRQLFVETGFLVVNACWTVLIASISLPVGVRRRVCGLMSVSGDDKELTTLDAHHKFTDFAML